MPKTTNETIKSVIQDWLAECETTAELMLRKRLLINETDTQFWVMVTQMSKLEKAQ